MAGRIGGLAMMIGAAGWIWMFVWVAALLFLVWLIVQPSHERTPAEDALAILRARFARGEISEAEFERAREVLGAPSQESPR
jgi:putative membrane protein